MCLSDFGPIPFLARLPCKILRKKLSNNSSETPHRNYDSMQNMCNHISVTCPSNMPSNRNNNDLLKDQYHAQTTKNKLVENTLDDIGFETMNNEEEPNHDSDCESVYFEGFSELNGSNVVIIRELMNSEVSGLQLSIPLEHPKLLKPPQNVEDKFSFVLGYRFHHMYRMNVPTNHCYKKIFFVSLHENIFA